MQSNTPSKTALLIGRSILLAAKDVHLSPLLAHGEEDATRTILGERARRGWFSFAAQHRWAHWGVMAIERVMLGGIFAHYLARKRWIEQTVRRAIEAGVRQVVMIGAGYDTLAFRLHQEFHDVHWFEIDHPATQKAKQEELGGAANLQLLAVNLAEDLPCELLATSPMFDPDRPAFVIAEGVTMYFPENRVAKLIDSMRRAAGHKGKVIFTFMAKDQNGSIDFRGQNPAVGLWLRFRNEPFLWGCTPTELTYLLGNCGLRPVTIANHIDLAREVLLPSRREGILLARGESICLCEPIAA